MKDMEPKGPRTFAQLAELYVAGLFAEEGWRVYFPHQDDGFDFIAMKDQADVSLIRPVQVKGKYPTDKKLDNRAIGFTGELTRRHPEMVLAIVYFEVSDVPVIRHVAFMPPSMFKENKRGIRCLPAKFQQGKAVPRGDHAKFFDRKGLQQIVNRDWKSMCLDVPEQQLVEEDED